MFASIQVRNNILVCAVWCILYCFDVRSCCFHRLDKLIKFKIVPKMNVDEVLN